MDQGAGQITITHSGVVGPECSSVPHRYSLSRTVRPAGSGRHLPLQMIADAIGVTKAAIYFQFRTKDEIVLAAAEDELARLEAVIEAAEAEPSPAYRQEVLLERIVDLSVDRRRTVSVILSDPVVLRFFTNHVRYRAVVDRLTALLIGPRDRR